MSNEFNSAIERLRFAVTAGTPEGEIDEDLADYVGELTEADQPLIRAALAAALAEQRAAEALWTDATSNDRLSAAFTELRTRGVVAIEHAGYTMSEGWLIVGEESERQDASGKMTHGGLFFHEQDVEGGVAGDGLMLAFGAFADGPDHAALSHALAVDICRTLRRHGVQCNWDGDINRGFVPFAVEIRSGDPVDFYALAAVAATAPVGASFARSTATSRDIPA